MRNFRRDIVTAVAGAFGLRVARVGRAGSMLEEDVLSRFLKDFEIDCIFDVGANLGQYAQLVRRLGFRGCLISFEPNPALIPALRYAARKDHNWFIEEAALDEARRSLLFNIMESDQFSSLKLPSNEDTEAFKDMNAIAHKIRVQTSCLIDFFDEYRRKLGFKRPFLKMDTQGNDLAVARGAGSRLGDFVGLQSELAIKRLYLQQADYREAIDFYEAAGFLLTAFVPNNDGHFPNLFEIDCIMYNSKFRGAS